MWPREYSTGGHELFREEPVLWFVGDAACAMENDGTSAAKGKHFYFKFTKGKGINNSFKRSISTVISNRASNTKV